LKIDVENQQVTLDDDTTVVNHKKFMNRSVEFWDKRIVGKTIIPIFYEYLFGKGGSNALELLMKGMKHEGYLLGSMDKWLTHGQKIALATVVIIIFVAIVVFIILRSQGLIPGM